MFVIRKDMEFAMPPRGVTVHKNVFGGVAWKRITWRCEVEGCWHVEILRSEGDIDASRLRHKEGSYGFNCPSPPMREELPSGLPEIEKLWRELDDVTDALMAKQDYRGMDADKLKAYAQGLSFTIVMKDKVYFPDTRSVSKECVDRWKMRNDKLAYRKTPTSQDTRGSWMAAEGWNEDKHGSVAKVRMNLPKPSTDTPAIKAGKAKLDAKKIRAIKNGLQSGMFARKDLADMYSIPEELVSLIEAGEYGAEI